MTKNLFELFKEVEFKFIYYSEKEIGIEFKIGTVTIRTDIPKQNMFYSDLESEAYFIYRDCYKQFGHFKNMDISVEENENI